MTDALGYRLKIAILIPSTNTSVQPETDALRPQGVTNHVSRMLIANDLMTEQPGFNRVLDGIRSSTQSALASVLTSDPDHLIVGVSPESYWDGPGSHEKVHETLQDLAGDVQVTMSPDAIDAALQSYGGIRRIAVITPYLPLGDTTVSRYFTDNGYDLRAIQGLGAHRPALISHVSEQQLREAIIAVDGPDVDAIVQVGTNVACARFAANAEDWIGKPVLSNNAVLYWHALRSAGVNDRCQGWGSLFSMH